MKKILNNLFEYKTLSRLEAREVLFDISTGSYNSSQVSAFMSVYLMRSITVSELSGFRDAMLDLCLQAKFSGPETIDIVGTGGDGKDTFNISTLACFVAAGAGIRVSKHGNYGVSSVTGSSNVLEAIGYRFTNDQEVLERQLERSGVCFLHAPLFHPAMQRVAPLRKELGVRTFFNMLGPVINPCQPKYQLLGVYNLEMARLYNYLLQDTEVEYSIVHSLDGHDEVSLTSDFKVIGRRKEQLFEPSFLGLKKLDPEELHGGASVGAAARLFLDILKGEGSPGQNAAVIANAAMAIQCVQSDKCIEDCMAEAEESLLSKRAYAVYKSLVSN